MRWVLIVIFSLSVQAGYPQSSELTITRYTESDGLSSNIIRCILQDSRGILWIGTPDGLNYYDGYNFNTLRKNRADSNTIRANFITKLAEDQVGDIWIGFLYGGVSSYNIATGVFRHYPLKIYDRENQTQTQEITMLHIDKLDNIWIGVRQGGLYKLDKYTGRFSQFNLTSTSGVPITRDLPGIYNTIYALHEDHSGLFWLATHAGLYTFDPVNTAMKHLRHTPLHPGKRDQELLQSISRDGNYLWMGTWTGGLARFDTRNGQWAHFDYTTPSPASNIIPDVLVQEGDSLMIVAADKGIGYFNKKNKQFSFLRNTAGSKPGNVKSVYKDRSGNIWIAGDQGLMKTENPARKFRFTPVESHQNTALYEVSAILENRKWQLLGTSYDRGLYVKNKLTNKETVLSFDIIPGEEQFLVVTDLLEDAKGRIWILTRDFLYQFDETRMTLRKVRQPGDREECRKSDYLSRIQSATDGRLWIATLRNGLYLYDTEKDAFTRHYSTAAKPPYQLPTNHISSLHEDEQGNTWIGGNNGFLGRIDARTAAVTAVNTSFPQETIRVNTVYDIASDKGKLWAGTDAGLLQYAISTAGNTELKKIYTAENGISADLVKSVSLSDDGNIWCITQTALCRLDTETESITSYGYSDGLQVPAIGTRIRQLSKHSLSICSVKGYYSFNPEDLIRQQSPPPVIITSFTVNGHPRFYGQDLGKYGTIQLAPSENHFSFEFASIDYNKTGRQRYAYKLEGFDADWTNTHNRYAGYANLQPGNYVFKVKATGGLYKEESKLVTIPVFISGHFYKSTWFRLCMITLLLLTVFLIYHFRLRNQQRLHKLEHKADMLQKEKAMAMYEGLKQQLNPHFLFNSLTSLSSLIRTDQKLAGQFLDGLSSTYRYILNNREKELVPLIDEIKFSEAYVKLQHTRFGNALQVNIDVGEEFNHMKIAPVTLQNLFENAVKHNIVTDEDPLIIDVRVNDQLQLVIKNNLNKKEFVETSNRQGLESLRSLYSYLSDRKPEILETEQYFIVKIPLL